MSAVESICAKLRHYPHVRYEHTAESITVAPSSFDGFPVSLHQHGGTFVVGLGGWHGHFDSETEALDCFAFGLSDHCRLHVTSRGGVEHHWTVQRLSDGAWRDQSTTGLLCFPFWRRRTERFYQNRVVCGRLTAAP